MKHLIGYAVIFTICFFSGDAGATDKPIVGPKKFDVINRDGERNLYTETFQATEGPHLLKIQNGEAPKIGSTFIELKVNDRVVLKDGRYEYPFTFCMVELKNENKLELVLKDAVPLASRPPKPPARVTIISVLPPDLAWPDGLYGVNAWEQLNTLYSALLKMKDTEALSVAFQVINLKNDLPYRSEAMRRLADRKDAASRDFLSFLLDDRFLSPEIKGEVAATLGALHDKGSIERLTTGLLDEQEKVRIGSARGLSFYPEEETRELLIKTLQSLDPTRWSQTLSAVSDGGLKHVETFIKLAESSDSVIQNIGLLLLGDSRSPLAVEYLMRLLKNPGKYERNAIIKALGATRSPAVLEPLSDMARDASARAGVEMELAKALASLGDQKSAPLIGAMIDAASPGKVRMELRAAYRQLTGTKYKKK
jgi:HEAT repeat protein